MDLACVRADETGKGRTDARARVRAGETGKGRTDARARQNTGLGRTHTAARGARERALGTQARAASTTHNTQST